MWLIISYPYKQTHMLVLFLYGRSPIEWVHLSRPTRIRSWMIFVEQVLFRTNPPNNTLLSISVGITIFRRFPEQVWTWLLSNRILFRSIIYRSNTSMFHKLWFIVWNIIIILCIKTCFRFAPMLIFYVIGTHMLVESFFVFMYERHIDANGDILFEC